MADKKGREAELLELQKAEESHRDLLLKDRDERNKIAKDLHSLRKYGGVRSDGYEISGAPNCRSKCLRITCVGRVCASFVHLGLLW